MLETAHAAMRPWPLFSHESFGHVLMLDSYMHARNWSMGTIELHDPTGCFMSVGKLLLSHASVHVLGQCSNRPHFCLWWSITARVTIFVMGSAACS